MKSLVFRNHIEILYIYRLYTLHNRLVLGMWIESQRKNLKIWSHPTTNQIEVFLIRGLDKLLTIFEYRESTIKSQIRLQSSYPRSWTEPDITPFICVRFKHPASQQYLYALCTQTQLKWHKRNARDII